MNLGSPLPTDNFPVTPVATEEAYAYYPQHEAKVV